MVSRALMGTSIHMSAHTYKHKIFKKCIDFLQGQGTGHLRMFLTRFFI